MKNSINTWQQGRFIDSIRYKNMPESWKQARQQEEKFLVRPAPHENAICQTFNAQDAAWIASRLNLASKLEQMTYDFATGKSDGSEMANFVKNSIKG